MPNVDYPTGGQVIEDRIPGKIDSSPGDEPGGPGDVSPKVTSSGEGIGPAPRIVVRIQDEVVVATPGRKLTAGESGPALRQELQKILDSGERKILLDMSGVESMDSSGLGELTWLKDAADAVEAKIALLNLDEKLRTIFNQSGLPQLIEVFENEADAIKHLGR
ncbi:MAG: STAS domain-containing protein [Acidobacteria bacterium]|nr:STAS domain-containing protein [Acidobacteriota bacterium]